MAELWSHCYHSFCFAGLAPSKHDIHEEIERLKRSSRQDSTLASYVTAFRHWAAFTHTSFIDIPAAAAVPGSKEWIKADWDLNAFVVYLSHTTNKRTGAPIKASTISSYLTGIGQLVLLNTGIHVLETHPNVRRLIQGVENEQLKRGVHVNRKLPFTAGMLLDAQDEFFLTCEQGALQLQMRTAAWLSVEFGLRVGEAVPGTLGDHFARNRDLSPLLNAAGDVVGITLVIRSSKTSTIPEPRHIDVVTLGHRKLQRCACGCWFQIDLDRIPLQLVCVACGDSQVEILVPSRLMVSRVVPICLNFLKSSQHSCEASYPDRPLFPLLSPSMMSDTCRAMASSIGMDEVDTAFAAHSWRRGAIVDASVSHNYEDSNIQVFFRFATDCWKVVYAKLGLVTLFK
jgi:hypothetical protein